MLNKKTIFTAFIVVGFIVLAVAATMFGYRFGRNFTEDQSLLPTDGWATHVSGEAGFSFRYPADLFDIEEKAVQGGSGKAFQIVLRPKSATGRIVPAMAFTGVTWDYSGWGVIGYQGFAVDEDKRYFVLTNEDRSDPIAIADAFDTGVGPAVVVDDGRSPATRLIQLHRHAEKVLVNLPHQDYHGMLVERTAMEPFAMDRRLFFTVIGTLAPTREAAPARVPLLTDFQRRVRDLKSVASAGLNAEGAGELDAEKNGYRVHSFGNLTVVFDSTSRVSSPFKPKVYTPAELQEKANRYIVDVEDTAECSATDVTSLYIVDGINNSGIYDYALLSINHFPFEGEVRAAFEAVPKEDCLYFVRTADTQPLIDRFLEAYEQQYKEMDSMRFAEVIEGTMKADHPLVKEMQGVEKKWVTYVNPDYGIQFDYKETWPEPRVSEDKEKNQVNMAFGPLMNWEGDIKSLYSLRIFINKPNVVHVPLSRACPNQYGVTVCQQYDPMLEPDKVQRVNMDDQEEVYKTFVQEFTVNGMKAYASRLGDAFTWNRVFISGLHNGYLFSGGIDDKDYDRVVKSFREDKDRQEAWYEELFAGYMTGDPVACPEHMDVETFPKRLVGFYGGYDLNGCGYEADSKKLEPYQFYPVPRCAESLDEALGEHDYDVLNGCLYYRDQWLFEESLFTKVIYGDFGEQYFTTKPPEDRKTMGESAGEWFRFEDKGKLYIFLRGGAGCGGCVYNGPYLVIDLRTGKVETKDADLPYLPHNIFSPDRRKAVTFDYDQSEGTNWQVRNVRLSVFDFLAFNEKEVYAVPDDASVLAQGMGVFFIDGAITWLDETRVRIQLYEGAGVSAEYLVTGESGPSHDEYTVKGEPIILQVN